MELYPTGAEPETHTSYPLSSLQVIVCFEMFCIRYYGAMSISGATPGKCMDSFNHEFRLHLKLKIRSSSGSLICAGLPARDENLIVRHYEGRNFSAEG